MLTTAPSCDLFLFTHSGIMLEYGTELVLPWMGML
jgi:hypothetical protein